MIRQLLKAFTFEIGGLRSTDDLKQNRRDKAYCKMSGVLHQLSWQRRHCVLPLHPSRHWRASGLEPILRHQGDFASPQTPSIKGRACPLKPSLSRGANPTRIGCAAGAWRSASPPCTRTMQQAFGLLHSPVREAFRHPSMAQIVQ